MTLQEIIDGLEKSAGFEDIKAKAEEAKESKKDEDKSGEGDGDGAEKSKDKKDVKKDQEKSAAFKSGEQLAKEIMEKVASIKIDQTKGEEMNKQASDAGKALAQALLTKLASVGDTSTTNGIPAGTIPNKTQQDLAAQVAEHDQSFQATPGTDGAGNGGTINQIFDAIVADAQAKGVVQFGAQTSSAAAEGANSGQAPNQVQVDESREKMAAAVSLVNSGVDFDEAVAMVKAASEELEAEQEAHVKVAAFNELMSQGVDFDLAVAMVKQAGAMTTVANKVSKGMSMGKKVGIGAAAGAAAGATAMAMKKKAALDSLIDSGIDYDSAVAAVAKL